MASHCVRWMPSRRRGLLRWTQPRLARAGPILWPELIPVGASLLAMDVNDNACCLNGSVVLAFFVGTPPGASSLPQRFCVAAPFFERSFFDV
ncbi:hypothetical protein EMIT0196MI5_130019 [Pseudomonas sp. IT-196MI5]